jgi:thiamine-phosphate diphosphorylase
MRLPPLHIVTNDAVLASDSFAAAATDILACCGPRVALHLRGHATPASRLFQHGEQLAAAALRSGSCLFLNDRVDIAMAVRADGVQLGVRSLAVRDVRMLLGAGARIGYSAHGALEAEHAGLDGADFVLLGTIYPSPSHAGHGGVGVQAIRESAARAGVHIVAIGGITPGRVPQVVAAGAYGVAVLSGVWDAPDPAAAAADYLAALERLRVEAMEMT